MVNKFQDTTRNLAFSQLPRTPALPAAPAQYMWDASIGASKWGMMDNDKIGDCTCAAAGHMIMGWSADNKKKVAPTTASIVSAYSAITGYNPKTGANDNGANETDVLNYWRKTGIAGHKIGAFAATEPTNHNHIMQSVFLLGGCYIGLALPLSAQTQTVWSVPPGGTTGKGAPGSWGGHAVPVIGYDANGVTVITWGATKVMTWAFWAAYCDESYAILSPDFVSGTKPAPSGFDLAALQADLSELK